MRKLVAFFDGGNRKEIGAGGAVIYDGPDEIAAGADFISGPHVTNNVAEYTGLLLALRMASEAGATELKVYGDSELVVRQVRGEYRALNPVLSQMRDEALKLGAHFDRVSIHETPRGKGAKGRRRDTNLRADRLCRDSMDIRASIRYDEKEVMNND